MNFDELKAALRAEAVGSCMTGRNHTLAKSFPRPETCRGRVVSARCSHVAPPLLKALAEVPNEKIKEAAVDSASRRREIPNAAPLLGGGKRAYRVVYGGSSLSEEAARAAGSRAVMDGRVTADGAIRIEHCLNEHRTMPAELAAKLF